MIFYSLMTLHGGYGTINHSHFLLRYWIIMKIFFSQNPLQEKEIMVVLMLFNGRF